MRRPARRCRERTSPSVRAVPCRRCSPSCTRHWWGRPAKRSPSQPGPGSPWAPRDTVSPHRLIGDPSLSPQPLRIWTSCWWWSVPGQAPVQRMGLPALARKCSRGAALVTELEQSLRPGVVVKPQPKQLSAITRRPAKGQPDPKHRIGADGEIRTPNLRLTNSSNASFLG